MSSLKSLFLLKSYSYKYNVMYVASSLRVAGSHYAVSA